MRDLIEIERVHVEIGNLVNETAIFSAHTENRGDIKVHASTVEKSSFRLPLDAVDHESLRRTEYQRAATSQCIRPNLRRAYREVRDECTRDLVKVRFNRRTRQRHGESLC